MPKEQWRCNRIAINIAAALVSAGLTFVMPFLPLYVRDLGVRDEAAIASWSGLLITIAPLLTHIDLRAVFFFDSLLFLGLLVLVWRSIRAR